jgi:deoxyribodipyrimidine photo-lyase
MSASAAWKDEPVGLRRTPSVRDAARMTTLLWFRQDLRLADNPALRSAVAAGEPVIPVYVLAPEEEGSWAPGAASRWWLHHSLQRLANDLEQRGSRLILRAAPDSLGALLALAEETGATRVLWNRRYEPAIVARDRHVKAALRAAGIETQSDNSALLYEPWTVKTKTGSPFQVFTPFWRHCKAQGDPPEPLPAPPRIAWPRQWPESAQLGSFELMPPVDWAEGMREAWVPGSEAAHTLLERFLADGVGGYSTGRDQPGIRGTSRLSPYLHFGEIGPREVWHGVRRHAAERRTANQEANWRDSRFLTELGWREFAHHLLYHFPLTPEQPLRPAYARFPWKSNEPAVRAWQRGLTGYPIVDAGLRELWRTGWMHNRVRMIAGSFLIKDLLVNWTVGARWFWDTLVDADLASNTLGWQWVAGSGADAAPFFRIFNPTSQGLKFDPEGLYVRRWVPEISALPNDWIHQPWAAPPAVLHAAGITLGEHYPHPLVDHEVARRQALGALAAIKVSIKV